MKKKILSKPSKERWSGARTVSLGSLAGLSRFATSSPGKERWSGARNG